MYVYAAMTMRVEFIFKVANKSAKSLPDILSKMKYSKKKKKWNKGATVSSNIDNNISFQLNSNEIYKSPFCEEKVEKYRSLCHSIQSHLTLRLLSFSLSLIRRGNIYHIIEIFLTIHYANYLSNAHLYIYRDNNFS